MTPAKLCLNLWQFFLKTGFFFFFFHISHEPMFWNLRTKPEKCSRLCSAWSFNLFGWQATFQFRALGKKIYSNFSKPGLVFPNWKNKNLVRGSPTLRRRVSVRYYEGENVGAVLKLGLSSKMKLRKLVVVQFVNWCFHLAVKYCQIFNNFFTSI